MTKITNLGQNPVSVYCGGVSMAVAGGEFLESDNFTEAEVKFYKGHPEAFDVDGAGVKEGATDAAELAKGNEARATLSAIIALFGTDEVDELNVKAAVERLIQDAAKFDHDGNGSAGGSMPGSSQPMTLAEAVASLDDANDDHWTQAGHPDIATLKTLTGGDVTRAQVDQLPAEQKRERAK